jgi:hypothetical protein
MFQGIPQMSTEIAKFLLTTSFITAAPVSAETLVAGATYFDSLPTFDEVHDLTSIHDDQDISVLTDTGHIKQVKVDTTVVVLLSGTIPEEPAEFRFLSGPTTFWTFTKNITDLNQPIVVATPSPTPTSTSTSITSAAPSPTPTPIPVIVASGPSPTATPKATPTPAKATTKRRKHESDNPPDDDNGRRIWHKVNGKWKWYDKPVKRALPVEPQTNQ